MWRNQTVKTKTCGSLLTTKVYNHTTTTLKAMTTEQKIVGLNLVKKKKVDMPVKPRDRYK